MAWTRPRRGVSGSPPAEIQSDDTAAPRFVVSANLMRRHLDAGQRDMVAARRGSVTAYGNHASRSNFSITASINHVWRGTFTRRAPTARSIRASTSGGRRNTTGAVLAGAAVSVPACATLPPFLISASTSIGDAAGTRTGLGLRVTAIGYAPAGRPGIRLVSNRYLYSTMISSVALASGGFSSVTAMPCAAALLNALRTPRGVSRNRISAVS